MYKEELSIKRVNCLRITAHIQKVVHDFIEDMEDDFDIEMLESNISDYFQALKIRDCLYSFSVIRSDNNLKIIWKVNPNEKDSFISLEFTPQEIEYKKAIIGVIKTLREDPEMFRSFKDNIVMAYKDEAYRQKSRDSREKLHSIANVAAENFLNLLCKE